MKILNALMTFKMITEKNHLSFLQCHILLIQKLLTTLPSDNAYVYPIHEISSQSPDEDQKLKIYGWCLSTRVSSY